MKRIITLSFLLIFSFFVRGQGTDTLGFAENLPVHSPRKATLLSMAVPGLGQAYNKKYWKIPLVYAAISIPLFIGLDQQSRFKDFRNAYKIRVDGDSTTIDKYADIYEDEADLLGLIDFHRKNRDLSFVLVGIAYALNVIDATVDAHLYHFNVSDDLSAYIRPNFQYSFNRQTIQPSLTLSLKFTKKPHRKAF